MQQFLQALTQHIACSFYICNSHYYNTIESQLGYNNNVEIWTKLQGMQSINNLSLDVLAIEFK